MARRTIDGAIATMVVNYACGRKGRSHWACLLVLERFIPLSHKEPQAMCSARTRLCSYRALAVPEPQQRALLRTPLSRSPFSGLRGPPHDICSMGKKNYVATQQPNRGRSSETRREDRGRDDVVHGRFTNTDSRDDDDTTRDASRTYARWAHSPPGTPHWKRDSRAHHAHKPALGIMENGFADKCCNDTTKLHP